MRTGPFLPLLAILKAFLSASARSSILFTKKVCFVIGIATPVMHISWKASRPIRLSGTFAVMAIIGMLSIKAVAIPVTRFVAPGPLVAKTTPVLPVAL